ncbi:MAG: hypothetical protein M3495_07430 [Pseudomonadota bacterium]|nr:hypothetical protein [Gammaproteobacteria bacterium]MDQ3581444.1 hypothetical protein [Pseudomonadota bacterium]
MTTMTALRSATNGLWIGVGTEVRARNEHFARRPTPAAWISPEGARTPRRY